MTEQLHFHFSLSCFGDGNGNPLQCSCLENPRDGGAWWAAVYGVAQSWTQLKRLSSSSSSSRTVQPWVFFGRNDAKAETRTLATSCEELTHWKRLWCWEGLGAGGKGDDRGWDGWMASPTRWMWVWVNSRRWWWTGRPGMLRFMGSQSRTWLSDWTELRTIYHYFWTSCVFIIIFIHL